MPLPLELRGMRLEPWNALSSPAGLKIDQIRTSPDIAIFTGTANIPLTRSTARILEEDWGIAAGRYDDGEVGVQLPNSVDGRDVFLIQPTNPFADNLMELLLMIDACRRAGADRINVIIPYFGYSRKDRKDRPRAPISSALVADLLQVAGANTISTIDIHAEQELGFFRGPWNNLYASKIQLDELAKLKLSNPSFVSVDIGGSRKTRAYAKRMGLNENKDTATVLKDRSGNISSALFLEGDVKGRDVVFIDDIIRSGLSLTNAAELVKNRGANNVYAVVTHGLMLNQNNNTDEDAINRLKKSPIKTLFITDTVRQPREVIKHERIKILSTASLLAELVKRLHQGISLSPDLVD